MTGKEQYNYDTRQYEKSEVRHNTYVITDSIEKGYQFINNFFLDMEKNSLGELIPLNRQGYQGRFLCQEDFKKHEAIFNVKSAYELFLCLNEIEGGQITRKLPYFFSEREIEKWFVSLKETVY